jgi:hypothetical protein
VLVHGFEFDPTGRLGSRDGDDPYGLVYGYPVPGGPDAHLSFLPLAGECDEAGGARADIAVAFAWVSEGSLLDYATACWDEDYKYAALDLAPAAARALAAVLVALAEGGARVRILAHSLGTRTVSQAIGLLKAAEAAHSVERAVLLGAAEYGVDAAANFAGCGFDVFNLASRRDEVLELGAQPMCHPVRVNGSWGSYVIGRCGLGGNPRWLDWQLDRPALVAWLAAGRAPGGAAYHVDASAETGVHPLGSLNHWAYYTNDGNRALVRDLLAEDGLTVAACRAAGAPDGVECPEYGGFAGMGVPLTPLTCAARRPQQVAGRAGGQPPAA